jgi:hypothetical protein
MLFNFNKEFHNLKNSLNAKIKSIILIFKPNVLFINGNNFLMKLYLLKINLQIKKNILNY